jgi:phage repressor protein C with HTH and peptisase S24 domain
VIDKEEQPIWVKNIRQKSYLSQRDFGSKIGVSGAYIGQIETGETPLSEKVYKQILETFGHLSNDKETEYISLDYYPQIFGSCGSGVFALSEEKQKLNVPKSAFMFNYSENKIYSVINAWGDSMNPFICNKDKLIVEHLNGEQIKDNHIYVFCYNNEIFVKRLIKNIDEVIIKSDNPDPIYRPRIIEGKKLNDLYIIGEIVGLMRNLR